jgi:predicted deacylase
MDSRPAFRIGSEDIAPGTRRSIDLHVSVLSNHTPMSLPVQVIHGKKPGPALFISGVVHGDEVMGVEVVRRLLNHPAVEELGGTLLAVPIVNAYGLISHSRYMPDRRDLNRSFPGSDHGSLASVLADLLMREVVLRCNYGIDIHSAALHRMNLPQIRISPGDEDLLMLAQAFGAPVVLVSKLREGTLRQCALARGVKVLVYEGGEALRFDETAIEAALAGTLRVMHRIGMLAKPAANDVPRPPTVSHSSQWLRAPEGGIFRSARRIGHWVTGNETIGVISDPFGQLEVPVIASDTGIIIGQSHLPVVNRGDALFHIAKAEQPQERALADRPEHYTPLYDEDEII